MINIPTDLLRTFVLVVELRSFTRAAKAQGVTQPAVSAQIRRLHELLGIELFDKSAPGISLTPMGEQIMDGARRMLSVNDHIVELSSPIPAAHLVRVGVPSDCMGPDLERLLASTHARWPQLRFAVQGGGQRRLLQGLRREEIDVALALATEEPHGARHYWLEELAWAKGRSTVLDADAPVPLVAPKEAGLCHRVAAASLAKVDRSVELVFRAAPAEALRSAVAAGLGVMVVPRRRVPAELEICGDGFLPPLPSVFCGIYVREGAGDELFDQLAEHFAHMLRPAAIVSAPLAFATARAMQSAAGRSM